MAAVGFSDARYGEVVDFLHHEALLLDNGRFEDWLALVTEDIRYRMPVRQTMMRKAGSGVDAVVALYDDDHAMLSARVRRYGISSAWAADPPTRTRHFVSNITVQQGGDALLANSYILLIRSRQDDPAVLLSAERQDELVRLDGALKLRRRTIVMDHSIVPGHNLSTLL